MASRAEALPAGASLHDVTREVGDLPLRFPFRTRWLIAFGVALSLLALFVVSVGWLLWWGIGIWGNNIPVSWGFPIVNYVWWLGLGHAGTLISALLLLLGSRRRNALNRLAEAMTLGAVICAGIYPVIHLGRPWFVHWIFPYPSSMGAWPQMRSPLGWDVWAVLAYLIVSALFWYIGLVPDLATVRDRARTRGWQLFYGILALGWRGSAIHWLRWNQAYRLCAGIAVPLVVSVSSEYSFLFAAGTQPGWHGTVNPPYYVMGAVFSGFAIVTVISILIRDALGVRDLITDRHLDLLAAVLLATGLMTAYGYFAEIFDALYSGDPDDLRKMGERFGGTYAWAYWGAVGLNFVPLQLLWFRTMRARTWLLFGVAISVMIGMWCERFVIVVGTLYRDFLPSSFRDFHPTFWDWSTFIGTMGVFLTFYLLFIRVFPSISMFEEKEVLVAERRERSCG